MGRFIPNNKKEIVDNNNTNTKVGGRFIPNNTQKKSIIDTITEHPVYKDVESLAQLNPISVGMRFGRNIIPTIDWYSEKYKEGGIPAVAKSALEIEGQGLADIGKGLVEPIAHPIKYSQEHPLLQAMNVVPLFGALKSIASLGKIPIKSIATKTFIPAKEADALWRAIEPTQTNTKLHGSIQEALPTIQSEIKSIGEIPKTNKAFAEILDTKKTNLMNKKYEILNKFGEEQIVDGDIISNAMTEPLRSERFFMQNPALAKTIEKQAKFYKGKKYTLSEANKFLEEVNAETDSFWTSKNMNKGTRDPEIIYKLNEASAIRNQMYKIAPEMEPLQKLWGALDDISYELKRKVEIDEPVLGKVLSSAKFGNKGAPIIIGTADIVSGGGIKPLAMRKALKVPYKVSPFINPRTITPAIGANMAGQNKDNKSIFERMKNK